MCCPTPLGVPVPPGVGGPALSRVARGVGISGETWSKGPSAWRVLSETVSILVLLMCVVGTLDCA